MQPASLRSQVRALLKGGIVRRTSAILLLLWVATEQSAAETLRGQFRQRHANTGFQPPPESPLGFLAANPQCQSVSNGCIICMRSEADVQCSTPGIACLQGPTFCTGLVPEAE
jgi:hypothetical protein